MTYNLSGIAGPAVAGIISGAAGAATATLALAAHSPMTVMIALVGVGVPLAVAAATTSSLMATAILFGISRISLGPFTGALFTTRNHHASEELQAQVFTISAGLRLTMTAAGAALGGAIAGLPSPTQLLLAASPPLLCGALGALTLGLTSARRDTA